MVDKKSLVHALGAFDSRCILVVGDLMLDQFIWGEVSRISPEAPVPVVEVNRESKLLGGAANVANNLRALGCNVILGGVIGRDDDGRQFANLAESNGINTEALIMGQRPTTLKTRIVARGQQVVRVDRESLGSIDSSTAEALIGSLDAVNSHVDGIIVSDYAKGVVTQEVMDRLRSVSAKRGIPLLVDPKPSNRALYEGITLVTPNEREAEKMAGIEIVDEETLHEAAMVIRKDLNAGGVLITRGANGMALLHDASGLFSVPTMAREVFDVTGAGDTVIAALAMALVSGLELKEAAYLANLAAGVVVGKVGTATASVDELRNLLSD